MAKHTDWKLAGGIAVAAGGAHLLGHPRAALGLIGASAGITLLAAWWPSLVRGEPSSPETMQRAAKAPWPIKLWMVGPWQKLALVGGAGLATGYALRRSGDADAALSVTAAAAVPALMSVTPVH